MAKIASLDGAQRRVLLDAAAAESGVLTFHPVEDIYAEYRALRRTVEANRQYSPLMNAAGKVAKGGGKFTPRYTLLLDGTKLVVPTGVDVVNVTGEILTDDQTSPWDLSQVTGALVINYTPPEAEVIAVETGSGVTAQDKTDIAVATRAEVMGAGIEGEITLVQMMRLLAAINVGNIVRTGNTYSIQAVNAAPRERVAGTVSSNGNREITNLDLDP